MQAIAEIFNSVFGVGQARDSTEKLDKAYHDNVCRVRDKKQQDGISRVGSYTDYMAFLQRR